MRSEATRHRVAYCFQANSASERSRSPAICSRTGWNSRRTASAATAVNSPCARTIGSGPGPLIRRCAAVRARAARRLHQAGGEQGGGSVHGAVRDRTCRACGGIPGRCTRTVERADAEYRAAMQVPGRDRAFVTGFRLIPGTGGRFLHHAPSPLPTLRTPDRPRRAARRGRRPPARQPGAGDGAAAHPARLLLALPQQTRALFVALFVAGLLVALLDAAIPTMIGRLIGLLTTHAPDRLWAEAWPVLVGMGGAGADRPALRPAAAEPDHPAGHQRQRHLLIRWQSHWQVVRQGLPFFQEDFAGRIANRVMQAGPALRESVVQVGQRGLVHPGLRHRRGAAAGARPTGGWRCRSLVWFLLYAAAAALPGAADARTLARGLARSAAC